MVVRASLSRGGGGCRSLRDSVAGCVVYFSLDSRHDFMVLQILQALFGCFHRFVGHEGKVRTIGIEALQRTCNTEQRKRSDCEFSMHLVVCATVFV